MARVEPQRHRKKKLKKLVFDSILQLNSIKPMFWKSLFFIKMDEINIVMTLRSNVSLKLTT